MEQRTQAVPADASGGKLGLLRVLVACLVASPLVRSHHRRERSTISCGDMSLFAAIPNGSFNRQLRGRAEKADSPACACCQNHDADAARVEDSSTPAPRTYGSLFSSAFASWAKQRVKRRFLTEDRGARQETPAAGEGEDDEIDELSGKMARIKSPMRDEEEPPPRKGASRLSMGTCMPVPSGNRNVCSVLALLERSVDGNGHAPHTSRTTPRL